MDQRTDPGESAGVGDLSPERSGDVLASPLGRGCPCRLGWTRLICPPTRIRCSGVPRSVCAVLWRRSLACTKTPGQVCTAPAARIGKWPTLGSPCCQKSAQSNLLALIRRPPPQDADSIGLMGACLRACTKYEKVQLKQSLGVNVRFPSWHHKNSIPSLTATHGGSS